MDFAGIKREGEPMLGAVTEAFVSHLEEMLQIGRAESMAQVCPGEAIALSLVP